MSETGRLMRGYKWSLQAKAEGENIVYPKGITENSDRWGELQHFLEYVKTRDEKAVKKALNNLRFLQRSPKVNSKKVKELKEFLLKAETPKEEAVIEEAEVL